MIKRLTLALACLALPATAQEAVNAGTGVVLRGLDKVTGKVTEVEMAVGARLPMGRLDLELDDCRYPEGNPAGDAYAFLTVREAGTPDPVFRGWMIASAPALNALDHSRYDVWVLRCKTS